MKITKVVLDRAKLSSEQIAEKQNFETILKLSKQNKITTTNQRNWFYGAIGVASIGLIVGISLFWSFDQSKTDKNSKISKAFSSVPKENITIESAGNSVNVKSIQKFSISSKSNSELIENQNKEVVIEVEKETRKEDYTLENSSEKNIVEKESFQVDNKSESLLFFPSVAGVKEGDVSIKSLLSDPYLSLENDAKVMSYEIFYLKGRKEIIEEVKGNQIPSNICKDLSENLYQEVFISKVNVLNKNKMLVRGESIKFKIIQ